MTSIIILYAGPYRVSFIQTVNCLPRCLRADVVSRLASGECDVSGGSKQSGDDAQIEQSLPPESPPSSIGMDWGHWSVSVAYMAGVLFNGGLLCGCATQWVGVTEYVCATEWVCYWLGVLLSGCVTDAVGVLLGGYVTDLVCCWVAVLLRWCVTEWVYFRDGVLLSWCYTGWVC